MPTAAWIIAVTGFFPLWRAWRPNRQTSLGQAIGWAVVAWVFWTWTFFSGRKEPAGSGSLLPYLALCLTGCAGVAVLGGRRPGVGAWNFVLVGLFAVFLLPVAKTLFDGQELWVDVPRTLFLAGVLGLGLLNYLPTRLAPAACLLATGCTIELLNLGAWSAAPDFWEEVRPFGRLMVALIPWVAWRRFLGRRTFASEVDRLWLDFRDRFGLVWGQRLREQFNRAAAHGGWPVHLRWQGLAVLQASGTPPDSERFAALAVILRALLKRFGPAEPAQPPTVTVEGEAPELP